MEVARLAAEAGGAAAMRHFREHIDVERKADNSPVTIADKEAEAAIVGVIRDAFPDHDLLTEESGAEERGSAYRWIVDPLDGTRGFTRGTSHWGPLVALAHEDRVIAGAMGMPVLGESYWAGEGEGCYRNSMRLQVSEVERVEEAIVSLGELGGLLTGYGSAVQSLISDAFSTRCYGDVAGCAMVLRGEADVWLEQGVQIWDIAPFPVMLREAGGRYTDFAGGQDIARGDAIGTNGKLQDEILRRLGAS